MIFTQAKSYTKGRQGNKIQYIIIHWFGTGTGKGQDTVNFFANGGNNSSAHYVVDNDKVWKCVKDEDTAWHCGNWEMNLKSIGIEHAATINMPMTEATYQTSANLIRELCQKYNIPIDRQHIKGHNEIVSTQCPGTIDINKLISMATASEDNYYRVMYQGKQLGAFVNNPIDRINNLTNQVAQLENDIKVLQNSNNALQSQLEAKNRVIQDNEEIIKGKDKAIQNANIALENLRKENEELKNKITSLEEEVKKQTSLAEKYKREYEKIYNQLENQDKPFYEFQLFNFIIKVWRNK